jgi:hypothetical protein
MEIKWKPPVHNVLKINIDGSIWTRPVRLVARSGCLEVSWGLWPLQVLAIWSMCRSLSILKQRPAYNHYFRLKSGGISRVPN